MANGDQGSQDKRVFPRYRINDSSVLMLMPGNIVSYSLLDVSKSGLAFCYYGESVKRQAQMAIATLFAENARSSDFSVQVISNSILNKESLWQPTGKVHANKPYLWRSGVKFKFLSKDQEDVIGKYIDCLGINMQIIHDDRNQVDCYEEFLENPGALIVDNHVDSPEQQCKGK